MYLIQNKCMHYLLPSTIAILPPHIIHMLNTNDHPPPFHISLSLYHLVHLLGEFNGEWRMDAKDEKLLLLICKYHQFCNSSYTLLLVVCNFQLKIQLSFLLSRLVENLTMTHGLGGMVLIFQFMAFTKMKRLFMWKSFQKKKQEELHVGRWKKNDTPQGLAA